MRKLLAALLLLVVSCAPALAANCSAYPYTLQNGQTADANQVMSNFNTVLSCGNNQLLGVNNNLSDLQSASTARTNLGLGTASTKAASDPAQSTVMTYAGSPASDHDVAYISVSGGVSSIATTGISFPNLLLTTGNLAGLSSLSTSRNNLGLGSIATVNVTYSTSGPTGGANVNDVWIQYVP